MKKLIFLFITILLFQAFPLQYSFAQIDNWQRYRAQYPALSYKLYDLVLIAGMESGVDPAFILAICYSESRFNPYAISKVKARGLMQVMPVHTKKPETLYKPLTNLRAGSAIFKDYRALAHGNIITALKNYNSGPRSKHYNGKYITEVIANIAQSKPNMTVAELCGLQKNN